MQIAVFPVRSAGVTESVAILCTYVIEVSEYVYFCGSLYNTFTISRV
jgi:hypothetical protein